MRRAPPLIIGGGPAGAAAAILLARSGAAPLLVERSAGDRDVVCGGFLGGDALSALERLGVDLASLGARWVTTLRLTCGTRSAEFPLPFRAAGISRRTLDAALLDVAAEAGADVRCGVSVSGHDGVGGVRIAGGGSLVADAVFLATGKHDLRGAARSAEAGADPAVGLRVRLAPGQSVTDAVEGRIELYLFDRGYGGLILQDDGSLNLCLSVAASRLKAAGGDPALLLEELAREVPLLRERIAGSDAAGAWQAVARVPYGWIGRDTTAGLFRLGDQAAVVPSLAGDGVAIALASARLAVDCYLNGGTAAAPRYQRRFAEMAARPVGRAVAARQLAEKPWAASIGIRLFSLFPFAARSIARMTRIETC